MKLTFDHNSVELYIGRFRLELWVQGIVSLSGNVKVYITPSLSIIGSKEIRGIIFSLDWLTFNLGISLRWLSDEDKKDFGV